MERALHNEKTYCLATAVRIIAGSYCLRGGGLTREEIRAEIESRLGSDLIGLQWVSSEYYNDGGWTIVVAFAPPANSDYFINTAAYVTSHIRDLFDEQDLLYSLISVSLNNEDDELAQFLSWSSRYPYPSRGVWVDSTYRFSRSWNISIEELHELAAAMP